MTKAQIVKAPPSWIAFESVSATLDPTITVTGTPTIEWKWADGTTNSTANPGSKDMSSTTGKHFLRVTPWSAVTRFEIDADVITNIRSLHLLTNADTFYANTNNLYSIDITSMLALKYLRTYSNASLSSIGCLTNLVLLQSISSADSSLVDIGSLSALTALTYIRFNGNSLTDIGRLNTQHSLTTVYLNNNSFDALRVDRALCDVAESVAGHARTGTMNISSNTAPTNGAVTGFDGITAKADLVAAGWTVTTD